MRKDMKNYVRRTITFPNDLDEIIRLKFKNSGYTFINDLIVKLLELGIIRLDEEIEIKESLEQINYKLDKLTCNK